MLTYEVFYLKIHVKEKIHQVSSAVHVTYAVKSKRIVSEFLV